MACTQILVHRVGGGGGGGEEGQNKDFGTGSQRDVTSGLVSSVAQAAPNIYQNHKVQKILKLRVKN